MKYKVWLNAKLIGETDNKDAKPDEFVKTPNLLDIFEVEDEEGNLKGWQYDKGIWRLWCDWTAVRSRR